MSKKRNKLRRFHSQANISAVQQSVSYHRSAPLPIPAELERYEKILPGAAERIFNHFEQQMQHRHALENRVIESDCKNSRLGLFFGFFIGIFTILCGTFSIYQGHTISGTFIGTGGLSSLVGVFIYGSSQKRKERERKQG